MCGAPTEDWMGLVPKRGCLLTLAYYAFPRCYEFGERWWNDILTGENRRTRRKTCPSSTLSTTNPTWIGRGANPGLHVERPTTNDLSHSTALNSVVHWRACIARLLFIVFASFPCKYIVVYINPTRTEELNSHYQQSPWGWKAYIRRGAVPKGSFATLLSPPQCHAAFDTMSHTLVLVRRSRTLHSSATRTPSVGFWRGTA
jgi:hypothetical protein